MSARDDALRALDDRDWSGAEVETEPRNVTIVVSTRLPGDLAGELFAAAQARGVRPGVLLREYVEQALTPPAGVPDEPVTVRPSELRSVLGRALEAALRRPAA